MIKHTFLDKCNTIIKDSELNTGLNPVVELNAGNVTSRILLHFNLDELKKSVESGDYSIKNLKHILKMFNCGSVNLPYFNDTVESKKRASSFDVVAFKIPYLWDKGRGFDYQVNYFKESNQVSSKSGSTWFRSQTHVKWDEEGVYSYDTLANDDSLIVGVQHFDTGVEDLEMDITEYVNSILKGETPNYGLGLMFSPVFERGEGYEELPYLPNDSNEFNTVTMDYLPYEKQKDVKYIVFENTFYKWTVTREDSSFISFFGPETNTFFNPYLETINSEIVLDNRYDFHIGVKNRLYFFVSDNGELFNLDEMPTCTINDVEYPVQHSGKGIYFVEIKYNKDEVESDTILYDTWSNIVLNGEKMDDIEMEFVVLPMDNKIILGNPKLSKVNLIPSVYGITENENIKIGDIREVKVDFIEEYSCGKKSIPSKSEYRIYVKEGNREIDIFPYQPLERWADSHMFLLNTNDLIPNEYYVDLKVQQGRNIIYHNEILKFTVVSNITRYKK